MKKSDLKFFTVEVSLEAVSEWCGLVPSVVLAYAREFGIKIIDETDGYGGEVTFEVYLDFVLKAGLPIDTALNPDIPRFLNHYGVSIDEKL